ncbi:MAG: sodium/solute symporter [Cenarchaeum sp. SB0663_bin_5]|nr:sodium/solute symporter [Cenarchaeum sp. SB0663_bin_5]MYH03963.1 sodium/solute symporter [Cenarchaeum sp. SB0675_bin_21]MYL11207.1 sodium/solute symporter [Cenarchaeum sp. SB0669_bin_11]
MEFVLSPTIGYVVLIGVGLAMAAVVTMMVKVETKWLGTRKTSEWFYTAGRTIKTGLIAASIVSAWTWAATLLQSSTVTFEFGMAGAFWYAAGASIQVVLFSIIAIELKRKAPMTHTFPEMIYVRYGKHPHKVFLFFALLTNTIVTAMLVLGGAAVVNSLTGVDITLAAFLLPVGIVAYTVFGGLKATFFAEYINAGFIFVVVLIFVLAIYFTGPTIGGIPGMYDKLTEAALLNPVEGNVAGSFLTLASAGALVFGIINIVGNFGTVFVDQSYWQRAIAARPKSATGGFILGGLAWFAIPFALATTLGLAAVASGVILTEDQVGQGLVAPTTASVLMGDVGAILILTIIFTAVTAAGSSQLVSVSSLVTYDVYRTYMKPSATGRQLIRVSRYTILLFGMGMGLLGLALLHIGLSLQYVYLLMGILIGSAVAPIAMSLLWSRTGPHTAISGAIVGLVAGVAVWLASAYAIHGEITVLATGDTIPMLAGNISSISTSLVICVAGSMLTRNRFDFQMLRQKIVVLDEKMRSIIDRDADENMLRRASTISKRIGLAATMTVVVVWPAPLFLSGYVFTLSSFTVWVWLAALWAVAGAIVVIVLPLFEARRSIWHVISHTDSEDHNDVIYDQDTVMGTPSISVLVPIDGSIQSLRAMSKMHNLLQEMAGVRLYLLYVIEWPEENKETDENIMHQMQKEGYLVLQSVVVPREAGDVHRIVKVGDPSTRIVEMAESLHVDMIAMGRRGLGGTDDTLGHVTQNVIRTTRQPVILLD